VLLRSGGVCFLRVLAWEMSTFGNILIERLRTGLVDVQPRNQFRERSIALAKNLIFAATRKRGSSNEQIVLYLFFARVQSNGRQQPFFGTLGLIQKASGRVLRTKTALPELGWCRFKRGSRNEFWHPGSPRFLSQFGARNRESKSSAKYKARQELVAHWQNEMTPEERESLRPVCVKSAPSQNLLGASAAKELAIQHLFEQVSLKREVHIAGMLLRRGIARVSIAEALMWVKSDPFFVRPDPDGKLLTTRQVRDAENK
jgi:hypothetical protein